MPDPLDEMGNPLSFDETLRTRVLRGAKVVWMVLLLVIATLALASRLLEPSDPNKAARIFEAMLFIPFIALAGYIIHRLANLRFGQRLTFYERGVQSGATSFLWADVSTVYYFSTKRTTDCVVVRVAEDEIRMYAPESEDFGDYVARNLGPDVTVYASMRRAGAFGFRRCFKGELVEEF